MFDHIPHLEDTHNKQFASSATALPAPSTVHHTSFNGTCQLCGDTAAPSKAADSADPAEVRAAEDGDPGEE